jgi:hypothetical protein
MTLRSLLYRSARLLGDVQALKSGRALHRRVKNKAIGKVAGVSGFWRALWR